MDSFPIKFDLRASCVRVDSEYVLEYGYGMQIRGITYRIAW